LYRILHGFLEKEPMHSLLFADGVEPIHRPFLEHEAISFSMPTNPPEVVLVSSARTVDYWGGWGSYLKEKRIPVLSISSKTRERLRTEGIESLSGTGTGDGLVALLEEIDCSSFVHIGAEETSRRLNAALSSQRKSYKRVAVYRSAMSRSFFCEEGSLDLGCLNSERCAHIWKRYNPDIPVVCLGTSTRRQAEELGLVVLGTAKLPSRASLAESALDVFRRQFEAGDKQ
jgi:uroporphyrinogen-III synthase